MIGTEFVDATGQPNKEITDQIVKFCADHDLLLLTCGSYANVIRWIPPLVTNEQQIDEALKIFAAALDQAA
jgi:4-aminobutyrate aminotransferase-like enzyme